MNEWQQRYLNLMRYTADKGYLVEFCPKCNAVVPEDCGQAEEICDNGESEIEITYVCPECNHTWYV